MTFCKQLKNTMRNFEHPRAIWNEDTVELDGDLREKILLSQKMVRTNESWVLHS